MKWTFLDSDHPRYKYQLSKGDKQLLNTSIDISAGSVRVGDAQQKRVFLIYREGFLKNKIVLRNEYGYRLLSIVAENISDGEIRYNDNLYRFVFDEGNNLLTIFPDDGMNAIANYKLPDIKVINGMKKGVSMDLALIAISSWHSLNAIASSEPVLV